MSPAALQVPVVRRTRSSCLPSPLLIKAERLVLAAFTHHPIFLMTWVYRVTRLVESPGVPRNPGQ
jgi:hypothetical protein